MRKKIDAFGRVTLPSSLRETLDMKIGEEIEVNSFGDSIIIEKKRCFLCNSIDNLKEFKNGYICTECMKEIRENTLTDNEIE